MRRFSMKYRCIFVRVMRYLYSFLALFVLYEAVLDNNNTSSNVRSILRKQPPSLFLPKAMK